MTPWRFCNKCFGLFFDGNPQKGVCPAGGGHAAQGLTFDLAHNIAPSDHEQADWRFCNKCAALFFHGPENGTCPAGGEHETRSNLNFVLLHDRPEDFPMTQASWRSCGRCSGLFFDGFPQNGTCPAGGPHQAAGFNFVLRSTQVKLDDNA